MSSKRHSGAMGQVRDDVKPAGASRAPLSVVLDDRAHLAQDSGIGASSKLGMVYLLARIFYEVRDRTEEALEPFSLTPMQFTILSSLSRWKGMCSAELSRRFKVTPQTMGEMIGNLERRGLVVRQEDPANRRTLKLALSEEGAQLIDACNAQMRKMELDMFSALSPVELHGLRTRLIALHQHLGLESQ